ncbi:hypothetical protein LIPSTDRAFT_32384, partial [Lipomyces starkeyi NRRL Y-11557]
EGRIELAVQAYKNTKIASIRGAARLYDVPYSTFRARLGGRASRLNSTTPTRKLTDREEEVLLEWVLSMDKRGLPPRVAGVRRMADLLLAKRAESSSQPPIQVGDKWVRNFITRHPELKSKYSRRYDHQRAK